MIVASQSPSKPKLSIVVIIFNMQREADRTLYSLSSNYQQEVSSEDYEVLIVENGSDRPLESNVIDKLESNFHYFYLNTDSLSPAAAINFGVANSSGNLIGVMIDGARILSPGTLKYALKAFLSFTNPVVATLAWHLGPDIQNRSIEKGYSSHLEDKLLQDINWPREGYRLFEISTFAQSSSDGWFGSIAESNCFFLSRDSFSRIGGCDERFTSIGGGLVNLDLYKRACSMTDSDLVIILGEGTFHQVHGGIATNAEITLLTERWKYWHQEYRDLKGEDYSKVSKKTNYIGHFHPSCLYSLHQSVRIAFEINEMSDPCQ